MFDLRLIVAGLQQKHPYASLRTLTDMAVAEYHRQEANLREQNSGRRIKYTPAVIDYIRQHRHYIPVATMAKYIGVTETALQSFISKYNNILV